MSSIPKHIIQFWHDQTSLPLALKVAVDTTRQNNKDYDIIFADDISTQNLIEHKYGNHLLGLYNSIQIPACRSDLARLLWLHEYGGLYLDVSMEIQKPLKSFMDLQCEILLVQRDDIDKYRETPEKAHVINGIIGAVPNNDFIYRCFKGAVQNLMNGIYNFSVSQATGPMHINCVLKSWESKQDIVKKLSFSRLINSGHITYRRVPGVSNSWLQAQKNGIIDLSTLQSHSPFKAKDPFINGD